MTALFSEESIFSLTDFQYALVDQVITGKFEQFDGYTISLAPDFNQNQDYLYPVLIKLFQLDKEKLALLEQLQLEYIEDYKIPLISLLFKLNSSVSDLDIKSFFYKLIYREKGSNTYLYRLYDARIIFQLSWIEEKYKALSFLKYFSEIKLFYKTQIYEIELNKIENTEIYLDTHLDEISLINSVLDFLNFEIEDLSELEKVSKRILLHLRFIKNLKVDAVKNIDFRAALFHAWFLGEAFINSDEFIKMFKHENGYEQQSKALEKVQWEKLLNKLNINNEQIKNRVLYDY